MTPAFLFIFLILIHTMVTHHGNTSWKHKVEIIELKIFVSVLGYQE